MPSSLRNVLAGRAAPANVTALVGAFIAALAVLGCSKEGTTPTCDDNVTKDGILINASDNPCASFGKCVIDGDVHPAADCCVDDNGEPLADYELKLCLYGFGAVDLDSTGGAGASSGGTGGTGGTGGGP